MSAHRCPKLADLDDTFVGPFLGPIFEAAGITDEDLPDIIPDDLDTNDVEAMAVAFPKVVQKLTAAFGDAS